MATFNVDVHAGETFPIAFEADLTVPAPDKATVQSWVDTWCQRAPELRPLDTAQPADASITPLP